MRLLAVTTSHSSAWGPTYRPCPESAAPVGQERELCAATRLLPAHYLLLKVALMREAERRGGPIPRHEARVMFRLEPYRALRWVTRLDVPQLDLLRILISVT